MRRLAEDLCSVSSYRESVATRVQRRVAHGGVSAIVVFAALWFPAAACAHSGVTRGTDYRSRVLVSPAGVAARMIGGDDRLVVRRTGEATVLVLGYQSEPYLRLDVRGVWRNERSPAVLLNGVRRPTLVGIQRAERTAHLAPLWRRLEGGDTVVFHDHRTHWMSSSPPLGVRAHPREPAKVFDWAVPARVAGRPSAIRGSLFYVPPPPRWWWLVCAAAVALGATGGVVLAARSGLWLVWLAALGAIAASVAISVAAVIELPDRQTRLITSGALPAVAGLLVLLLATRIDSALAAAILFATVLAIAADPLAARLPATLGHSVIPSALSATAVRALLLVGLTCVAVTVAAVVPLVFGQRARTEGRDAMRAAGSNEGRPLIPLTKHAERTHR